MLGQGTDVQGANVLHLYGKRSSWNETWLLRNFNLQNNVLTSRNGRKIMFENQM